CLPFPSVVFSGVSISRSSIRQRSVLIVVLLPLIRMFPCSSRSFLRSSAAFHAHRSRSCPHRHFSVLIVVVLTLIDIFPCSSRSFLRSSAAFHAHRSRSYAHRHFSVLIGSFRGHGLSLGT